ncbi:hypothetical protein VNI00_008923 [Paramarasmius palmivorus]|uniref:WD40 repeat-like protein n=1 Tax=Paramarasmius palmivorus TaxID=297713 RepID=A0AAW0CRP9_9AGAR
MQTSQRNLYSLSATLHGHQGPAACIALNFDGTLVACGGYQGTSIWHLPTSNYKMEVPTLAGERGMTTALAWMVKRDNADDALAYGTEDGYLVFTEVFCQLLEGGSGTEITSLAYDANSSQLAVGHRSGVIHRFLIDGGMKPRAMKSALLPLHSSQVVSFGHHGSSGPEIWSFGRDSGEIAIIDENAKVLKTHTTGSVIGHAFMCIKDDVLILDDVSLGVALYKISTAARIRTFAVPGDTRRCRNIAIHDQGTAILSGSDHGVVYVFDRRTGDVKDQIPVGGDWVQSLSSVDIEGTPTIAVAQSGENVGVNPIQLWTRRASISQREAISTMERIMGMICVVMALSFILQNISPSHFFHLVNGLFGLISSTFRSLLQADDGWAI